MVKKYTAMKKVFIILLLISYGLLPVTGKAQTFSEWFQQKKTQTKYLTTQIAELEIYLGYVKKGYKIVSSGLNTVQNIKNGEFTLHDLYYTSLELVNPHIRNSPKTMDIVYHQKYILKATSALKDLLRTTEQLSAKQKTYFIGCINRLLEDVEKVRQELIDLTSDKTLQLTDNERLERLNALYERSTSQFVFTQQFASEVSTLAKSLQREQRDEQTIKEFIHLP